jgi:RimJ/RimL family protein N-acetyltransferase
MKIQFEKVNQTHITTIFQWLEEPHIKEFWDNSQAHKDDIINFVEGRKTPSNYCGGLFTYWIGFADNIPYCMIMTLQELKEYDIPLIKKNLITDNGNAYSMDYMIGNVNFFGKGLGAKTLSEFIEFFTQYVDKKADTFMIDPDVENPRAKHVYEQAGFKYVDDFIMGGDGCFSGNKTHLLVKKL